MGKKPALAGNLLWYTMLTSLYKHIYRGHKETTHCLSFTLASWDCKERTEVLCREGWLEAEWNQQHLRSRLIGRSRSRS